MRAHIITAAVLLAATAVALGEDQHAKEVRRLRAVLAEKDAQIADLTARVAALRAEAATLRNQAARLRAAAAGPTRGPVLSHTLDIRVKPGGWGGASPADIKKVLASAGGELWQHFPDRKLAPIIVERSNSGPIVLYRKGPNGEHIVRLDVEGNHWSQFAYQFAHEFCHILTNYGPKTTKKNKWFIESICEMASVFAMRRMADTWRTAPPYPNWKSYAPHLKTYADGARVTDGLRQTPGGTLAAWYRRNAEALRKNSTLRAKNKVVANELLELFEADPQAWLAAGSIDLGPGDKDESFEAFLGDWLERTPARHKTLVRKVAALFEIEIPAASRAK